MVRCLLISIIMSLSISVTGQTKKNTETSIISKVQLDNNINAWGSEPYWKLELNEGRKELHINDSIVSLVFIERIVNNGFTNEFVDTYRLKALSGEKVTLTLVKNEACPCIYDMGEKAHKISAYLLTDFEHRSSMWLGCASVNKTP